MQSYICKYISINLPSYLTYKKIIVLIFPGALNAVTIISRPNTQNVPVECVLCTASYGGCLTKKKINSILTQAKGKGNNLHSTQDSRTTIFEESCAKVTAGCQAVLKHDSSISIYLNDLNTLSTLSFFYLHQC